MNPGRGLTNVSGRHLVCSVGARELWETTYRLGSRTYRTRFAPVALARLLDLKGARSSILVTPEARDRWYDVLAEELAQAGLTPQAVEIPPGQDPDELLRIFESLVQTVENNDRVVLDVTFGLRHLPFVYFTALTYLTAYRSITIGGIYYGAFELKNGAGGVPIFDITTLFDLVHWYHAVQTGRESGDLRPLANLLDGDVKRLFQTARGNQHIAEARGAVRDTAEALAAGLLLETGLAARRLIKALKHLGNAAPQPVTSALALDYVESQVQPLAAPATGKKSTVSLTSDELERQLRVARWFTERQEMPKALLVLREWLVNLVLYRAGQTSAWLDRAHRQLAERELNAAAYRQQRGLSPAAERPLARLWQQVRELRNQLAHAGMRPGEVRPSVEKVKQCLVDARALLAGSSTTQLSGPSDGCLLVTPLGLSPGVIYSAITRLGPARLRGLVVVTSHQAAARLEGTLCAAGVEDLSRHVRFLSDVHAGFREVDHLLDDDLRAILLEAGEVVVNVTGGTTALQYAVERIAEEADRLGCRVRRVALVDRRPPEEQRNNPYVAAELVELSSPTASAGGDDDGPA